MLIFLSKSRLILIALITGILLLTSDSEKKPPYSMNDIIKLPNPQHKGATSLEQCLKERHSSRNYQQNPVPLEKVAQLLWAAQGTNRKEGYRTAPSAGALYPLELYIVAGKVTGLPQGIYRYLTNSHQLEIIAEGDKRTELSRAALGQRCVKDCAAILVISAVYERTTGKYGKRGIRYAHIEVGHAAQNIYLQAVSLNLGTVFVGAFYDDRVQEIMRMKEKEVPCCIMPVGQIK